VWCALSGCAGKKTDGGAQPSPMPAADGGDKASDAGFDAAVPLGHDAAIADAAPAADGGSGGSAAGGDGSARGEDAGTSTQIGSSPWGIASSASSSRSLAGWAEPIHATGIDHLRGFDTSDVDARLQVAADHQLQVSGILLYSSGSGATTFPVDDLPGWTNYVTDLATRCRGRVVDWEVWNEPPNFTDNKMPAAYAAIVMPAYDALKAIDPAIQVGLAAQSCHVNWLEQTILAGAKDHFDYLTVHPYETLGLLDQGFEGEFMAIVPTLRKMLRDVDPARADAPILFTEIGQPVQGATTPEQQAATVIKAYTMAIAQGVKRVHWFEGIDGDSGPFGLLDASGTKRMSYSALTQLIARLGLVPRYLGWLLLNDRDYGFVFSSGQDGVMVAWAPPGLTDDVTFPSAISLLDPIAGTMTSTNKISLGNSPMIAIGLPASQLMAAAQNLKKPFPWGGDFSRASAVTFTAGGPDAGLHALGSATATMVGGKVGRDQSAASGQSFTVDPNFLSYDTATIEITAVLRRKGSTAAGFNLKYESKSGQSAADGWYAIPGSDQWYTKSWTIADDQFVGKWGYNFSFDSDSTSNSQYLLQSVTVTKHP
jgi:hypothetical protein